MRVQRGLGARLAFEFPVAYGTAAAVDETASSAHGSSSMLEERGVGAAEVTREGGAEEHESVWQTAPPTGGERYG